MKKEYKKPLINIDDFEVTERIAGACAGEDFVKIDNFHDAVCVLQWEGYYADGACTYTQEGNPECYDTYPETEGYFWS